MDDDQVNTNIEMDSASTAESTSSKKAAPRDIKGNLPYSSSPGVLKSSLEGIITAERPDKFSGDFMSTVLRLSGGSARSVPPILKRMGFLTSEGSPTDRYSRFKSESGRSRAALEGLKEAFQEIFRRNEFAHRADEAKIRDIIVEITGLNKNDQIVRLISSSFMIVKNFISDVEPIEFPVDSALNLQKKEPLLDATDNGGDVKIPNLIYNINIILPETENVNVFNSIFKSLRENLLK